MSGTITPRNQRLVAQPSGNRCAFPTCRKILTLDRTKKSKAVNLGELAHIRGERPDSARFDPTMSNKERNAADNLMLLCLDHHTIIDAQPEEYSVPRLLEMKASHERWVQERLSEAAGHVTFVELEIVVRGIQAAPLPEPPDLTLTPPTEKLAKNGLGVRVLRLVQLGMANSGQVRAYLDRMDGVDPGISERLTQGFAAEYERLKGQDLRGDDLFLALNEFATQDTADFERQAAGLAVLTYLFEICEVFEP